MLAGGRVKGRKHFWESQFTQQALRKHFSCHDSISTLRWWGDGEGVGGKMEEMRESEQAREREMQEVSTEWESAVKEARTRPKKMNDGSFLNRSSRFIFQEMMETERLPATCRFSDQIIHQAAQSLEQCRDDRMFIFVRVTENCLTPV